MVKFSLCGSDDGEGPSNPTQKRRRVEEEEEDDDQQRQQLFGKGGPSTEQEQEDDSVETEEHAPADDETDDETAGSNVNLRQCNGSATNDGDRSISVGIIDPDVLDCCICFEPLNAPVFQCENGHIACSICCVRLRNKCPMCSMPIGYNRCRAIEKVLESLRISCLNANYGCKEMFSYCRKNDHEKDCIYLPCICPHSGCSFVASSKELSVHFSNKHGNSGIQFIYGERITVFLNIDQKAVVLQEKNDSNLFIVHNNLDLLGNIVHIGCVGPNSMAGFHYDVFARSQGSNLILQSITKIIQGQVVDAPSTGFLLIPSKYFGSGQVKLYIRIRSQHQH